VLFDPFEKQLDLPPAAKQFGNRGGWKNKIVGQENESLFLFGIVETDPAESVGIILAGIIAMEFDDLIGLNALALSALKE
jgi:hypothetical protein